MKHINKLWSTVFIAFLIAIAASAVTYRRWSAQQKLNATRRQLRTAVVGVESLFVDDCRGLFPAADNVIPPQLTTPIAYLKPELRLDPYGGNREVLHYYNRPEHANGSFVLIASRGPDGDFDMDRLPDDGWLRNITYETTSLGKPVTAEMTTVSQERTTDSAHVRLLPQMFNRITNAFTQDDVTSGLVRYGIAVYDPTNGLVSDGDVIYTNVQ